MSYIRLGVGRSNVYIYDHVDGYIACHGCILSDFGIFAAHSVEQMLNHLTEHRKAGHVVPDWLDDALRRGDG